MKYRVLCAVAVCLAFGACMTVAPKPRQIQSSFPMDKPFDTVWTAVIETFAEMNLPILNMEKVSGLITTDWIRLDDPEASDCGTMDLFSHEEGRRVKFNIFVKTAGDACELKVNAMFDLLFSVYGNKMVQTTSCVSTGKFEKEIYNRVIAKTQ